MWIHKQNTGSRPRFTAICSQTVRLWLRKNDQSDATCELSKFGIDHVVWSILFTCLPKLSILYMLAICRTFTAGEATALHVEHRQCHHCTSEGIWVYIRRVIMCIYSLIHTYTTLYSYVLCYDDISFNTIIVYYIYTQTTSVYDFNPQTGLPMKGSYFL